MRVRVALDVGAPVGHLLDLLPGQGVRGLSDDVRIDEQRERKVAPLHLRKDLGVGAAPAVVDGDDDGARRQRGAHAGGVLPRLLQRDDVVAGHREVAHLLAELLAADLHARVVRRLDDVIAEDRRTAVVRVRERSDGDAKEKRRGLDRPGGHGNEVSPHLQLEYPTEDDAIVAGAHSVRPIIGIALPS